MTADGPSGVVLAATDERAGSWRNCSSLWTRGPVWMPPAAAARYCDQTSPRPAGWTGTVAAVRGRRARCRSARHLRVPAAGRRHPRRRPGPLPRHPGRSALSNSPTRWRSPTRPPSWCCTCRTTTSTGRAPRAHRADRQPGRGPPGDRDDHDSTRYQPRRGTATAASRMRTLRNGRCRLSPPTWSTDACTSTTAEPGTTWHDRP